MAKAPRPTRDRFVRDAIEPYPGALRRSILRMVATAVGLLLIYSFVPPADNSNREAVLLWLVGLILFLGLIVRQVRKIVDADYPKLRAFEALALVVPVLLLLFSYTYFSLSDFSADNFSEPLDRIDALYFSTVIFGTVGFGDITATSQGARILVTIQILVGLVAAVGLARLMLGAADLGMKRRPPTEGAGGDEPALERQTD